MIPSSVIQLLACFSGAARVTQKLRAAARHTDRNRADFYRRIWQEAAEAIGGELHQLSGEILEIVRDDCRTRVYRNYTELDNPVALKVAGNKLLVHRLLQQHGLPAPGHQAFTPRTTQQAVEFLARSSGPCVVKPANGTGAGHGITTNIRTRSQLTRAVIAASAYGNQLLIEEQIAGDNYRLLYLDGQLVDAIRRRPPAIVGDGQSTVARLIDAHNAQRLRRDSELGQAQITWNADLRLTLAEQQLTPRSVPPAGTRVVVKTAINENAADENESVGDQLAQTVIEDGATAARLVGARLAGVDIITRDPTRSLAEAGGVILEVNTTPAFHFHYHKRDERVAVAEYVLRHVFGDAQAFGRPARKPRISELVAVEGETA